MSRGRKCPWCREYTGIKKDGETLYEHKYDGFSISGKKPRCPYSGGTYTDAKNGITPLARRMLDQGYTLNEEGKWAKPE